MNFDFSESMATASDADIIRILTIERNNYQELAIKAAEREMQKRNLSIDQIEGIKKANASLQAIQEKKSTTPLEFHWKMLAFIFPYIFVFVLSGFLKSEGYDKKANDLAKCTIYGWIFYICLFIYWTVF